MLPGINAAAMRVLDRLGIALIEAERAGCCGALRLHLDDVEASRDDARRNIDAWWPLLEGGCETIVMTASGCGVHVRDYAHLLQDDPRYAAKAARVALLTRDISEVVLAEKATLLDLLAQTPGAGTAGRRAAFHSSCTLQHGQKVRGVVEELLAAAGFDLTPVSDAHLCCGSAGTYSVLQPEISTRLRDNKLAGLGADRGGVAAPEVIASANIGCITHLQSGTALPVRHWIELLDERLA
jgi:glycolate oxidase iron-sulfur subunit